MADDRNIIEIYLDGVWVPAAELYVYGNDSCRVEYLPQYVFSDDHEPISLTRPVNFTADIFDPDENGDRSVQRHVPSFLYDLVPQGHGRRFLVNQLELVDSEGLVLPLLLHGAFNPIGRLRITTAVRYYESEKSKQQPSELEGFTIADMQNRTEEYLEHLALHAMLAAGTTGVQGVAPKYLLARNQAGRFFSDLALDDSEAKQHWLVKLPRGKTEADQLVLQGEAAYHRVAAICGIRTKGSAEMHGNLMFMPRFDRTVSEKGVVRIHQESLASLAGKRGFAAPATQNELLGCLRRHATDPFAETVEFLKRDVLNMALRNTDNHARNTAVQKIGNVVQLTPVFDFAPMFLDPEVVARSIHWVDSKGRHLLDWPEIVAHLDIDDGEKQQLAVRLQEFAGTIGRLEAIAQDAGVDARIASQCKRSIERVANSLARIDAAPRPVVAPDPKPAATTRQRRP